MPSNPVERNVVTRFLLGFAVIAAMMIGARIVGESFLAAGVPYARWTGTLVGALAVLVAFVVLYNRYDASFDDD